jgi:hypothetical protein
VNLGLRILGFFLCFLCFVPPLFAQNGSIQGIVVRNGSSTPLSKALVELRTDGNNASVLDSATTEDDGKFLFRNLPPGRYQLTASRAGYVRPPVAVTIQAGQPAPAMQLPMKPTAAIYGQIFDSRGGPLPNVMVQALRASYPEGRRTLTVVQSAQTNDLGEYRLFWLAPGRYYVAAIPAGADSSPLGVLRLGGGGFSFAIGSNRSVFSATSELDPAIAPDILRDPVEPQSQADTFVPVYFPTTTDEQAASAIDLSAGSEIGGTNIVVAPVQKRHVRGIVLDGMTGRPAQYASIDEIDDNRPQSLPGMPRDPITVNRDTGAFDIVLMPGFHTLTVNSASGSGYAAIRIADTDIDNLVISTTHGFDISGRIGIEGNSNPSGLDDWRIALRRDPPPSRANPSTIQYSNPLPNGSFVLEGGLGDFRVNIDPVMNLLPFSFAKLPANLQDVYVKSIRLGNVDVLNGGLHLEKAPGAPLEIVLGAHSGAISGSVVNNQGQPAGDVSVVLLPDVRRRMDLYKSTNTDPSGRFQFDHVPPGDYKIFAWTDIDTDAWYDAGFMRNYENAGTPARVAEGSKQELRLAAIP